MERAYTLNTVDAFHTFAHYKEQYQWLIFTMMVPNEGASMFVRSVRVSMCLSIIDILLLLDHLNGFCFGFRAIRL